MESEGHSQHCASPVLEMALARISPGKTFGGATDSSAPQSTTVSTNRNPALGASLGMAHTDLVSSSFIKHWSRGTRVYQHHSGAWFQLTFFLLPTFGRPSSCFEPRLPRAKQRPPYQECRALPELQICLSLLSEALTESCPWLPTQSSHRTKPPRIVKCFLTLLLGLLFLLAVHDLLRLILFVGSTIIKALSFAFAFVFVAFFLRRHFHIQLFTLGFSVWP